MSETELRARADLEQIIETRSASIRETVSDAEHERRDLSDMEAETIRSYKAEVDQAQGELRTVEARERAQLAAHELARMRDGEDTGDASLDRFAELLKSRQAGRVELRAATTANAGALVGVSSGTGRPSYLHEAAGIGRQNAQSLRIESPYFGAFVAQSETAEGTAKPVMTDPTIQTATLGAFAVVQDVSDQLIRFGVGLNVIGRRLESEVVYSINAHTATMFEAEGAAPIAFATSASHMLDLGIAEVEAQTGNFPGLIVLNPADYPTIANKEGADSGDDIGSRVAEFNGVRLAANAAQSAGTATVVDGRGWSAFGTTLMLDSLPDLSVNTVKARAEQYFELTPHYSGSAVVVDITSA